MLSYLAWYWSWMTLKRRSANYHSLQLLLSVENEAFLLKYWELCRWLICIISIVKTVVKTNSVNHHWKVSPNEITAFYCLLSRTWSVEVRRSILFHVYQRFFCFEIAISFGTSFNYINSKSKLKAEFTLLCFCWYLSTVHAVPFLYIYPDKKYTFFFIRIPKFFPSLNILNFSDFEPRTILKLFLNTKNVTSPENLSQESL